MVIFTGCSEKEASTEGYILKVETGRVLVAKDITAEKYNEIKDKSITEWSENGEYIPLIYLSYDDTSKLKEGNKVEVWIEGGVEDSYPQQARASKIETKN